MELYQKDIKDSCKNVCINYFKLYILSNVMKYLISIQIEVEW